MVKRKDSFWEHAEEIENGRFICKFCYGRFSGGISRIKSHLSGLSGRDIQVCPKVPEAIQLKAKEALQPIDPPTKRTKNVAASNNFLEGEIVSGSSSSHMPNRCKLDKQYATFLISNRICFDAISSPIFKDFLNGVAEHGPGYELPSSSTLKSRVIPDIKKEVEEYVKNVIKNSVKTGYTLMCNIRSCGNLIHYNCFKADVFAYTPIGMVCMSQPRGMSCMNPPTGMTHMSTPTFNRDFKDIMSDIMMLFRPANTVQFITGKDGIKMLLIKDILTKEYPQIYQTPCASSGIRLLLQKIALIPFVYNILEVANWIVSYILKHEVNVPLRRVHKTKSGVASLFFNLISLLEVESELQAFQVSVLTMSSDWEKLLHDKNAIDVAKFIDSTIRYEEFWSRGKTVEQIMKPLFQVLDLVLCDGPTFGYLYEMMERVQDAIKQCCGSNQVLYEDLQKILNEVRSDIFHPIHAAAAFLNPAYMCSEKFEVTNEMTDGVENIKQNLVGSEEKEAFTSQVQLYYNKDSDLFTDQAMTMLKTLHPRVWWKSCGNHLPVLQKYAIQILGQPCSSTLFKRHKLRRNWSKNCSLMVNTMIMGRYKSLETQMKEPIILDKIGALDDDTKFQNLWDDDDDDDDVYGYDDDNDKDNDDDDDDDNDDLLYHLSKRFMLEDPTGSWLDTWPRSISRPFFTTDLY